MTEYISRNFHQYIHRHTQRTTSVPTDPTTCIEIAVHFHYIIISTPASFDEDKGVLMFWVLVRIVVEWMDGWMVAC